VTIDSEPGKGTTVTLFLPLAQSQPQPADAGAAAVAPPASARSVLVVEDQPDVRHVVRRLLESLGHRVTVAQAATEALLLLKGPRAPDLLVTDIILATGMNGIDLANAAREQRPGLPVIFISGYTAVPEAHQRVREIGAPLLSKPFTTPQLETAVNTVCAAAGQERLSTTDSSTTAQPDDASR
jgi:CheY-like chemotaxis protein